ncbi:MAG: N-acetylglucosamine-6-phosphate deacetylase, partial [Actinomycetota bacterium]
RPAAASAPALAATAAAWAGAGPRILGAHLEGPFLSPKRYGAHDPRYVATPDVAFLERLLALGPVTHVTVAPEEPGGLDLVSLLVARGITVAVGHSDADAPTAHAAFDRGARIVTHLYNAQRPFSARDPGLIGASLVRDDVTVSLIVDGWHVSAEATMLAWRAAAGRFAIVTDAVQAAGLGDGEWVIGDRRITVTDGAARLADGTLAGSALTMDRAVRNLVGLGVPTADAIGAATRVPARAARRDDVGDIVPGMAADVVVLDDALEVRRTLVGGVEVFAA